MGCLYLQGLTAAWLVGRSVHEHMVHIYDAVVVWLWDVLLLFVALRILVVATWHCSRHSHKNVVGGDVPV